jgi:glucose/arabinose dehydrogenase
MLPPPRLRRSAALALVAAATLATVAACGGAAPPARRQPAPPAAAPSALVATPVRVPADLARAPFDQPRQALVPDGWTIEVWARVPGARLAAWTPDGALLVSRPGAGQVVKLTPDGSGGATTSLLLDGLTQPHGLAFDGGTLYVAESDRLDAYRYVGGAATGRRVIVDDLPDAKGEGLGGAYAHALKSVAVGPDKAVYFSIGSTGNISGDDRE